MAIDTIKASAILDGAVDTADIADDAVTSAKLDTNIDIAGTLDVTSTLTVDDNVFVGHTSQYSPIQDGGSGVTLNTNGQVFAGGQYPSYFNREDSDGDVLVFRKDGSSVGSIGAKFSGRSYIASGSSANTGVRFDTNFISPADATGANRDAALNIGSSGSRFKDLYLSGGAYIGGTAAANYLDDVEEGEWLPVIVGSTSGTATGSTGAGAGGSYIKIKNHVWLQFYFANPSISGTMSGDLYLNLPFANANNDGYDNGSGGEINTHRYFRSGATTYKITMRIVRGESFARFRVQRLGVDTEDYPLNQSTASMNGSTLIWGQLKMRVAS